MPALDAQHGHHGGAGGGAGASVVGEESCGNELKQHALEKSGNEQQKRCARVLSATAGVSELKTLQSEM